MRRSLFRIPNQFYGVVQAANSSSYIRSFTLSPISTPFSTSGPAAVSLARPIPTHTRAFTTTLPCSRNNKKAQKEEPKRSVEVASTRSEAAANDPFDFTNLDAGIAHAIEKLKDELSKLKPGGRFNPDLLEGLRVQLEKGSKDTVKLGDLAQVVPRSGRSIAVLIGEAEHTKPITTAILSSPHSLNPGPSPTNPLELHIPIPPPTADSRAQTLAAASKAGEVASYGVRQARGAQQKLLRSMELARTVLPDDLVKAKAKMEKVVETGYGDVKKMVEGSRRALERG